MQLTFYGNAYTRLDNALPWSQLGLSRVVLFGRNDYVTVARFAVSHTPRDQEILQLSATGLNNRKIGETRFISERTVRKHSRP